MTTGEQAGLPATRAPASTAATELARAQAAHGTGRLDDAARDYRAALEQAPGHPEALHGYGVLQFQRGAAGEA
ncbi:tetratricopeptide repeat protein, partial [Burkholderia sp. Ax-1720]